MLTEKELQKTVDEMDIDTLKHFAKLGVIYSVNLFSRAMTRLIEKEKSNGRN